MRFEVKVRLLSRVEKPCRIAPSSLVILKTHLDETCDSQARLHVTVTWGDLKPRGAWAPLQPNGV